jgi:hypothetical protein
VNRCEAVTRECDALDRVVTGYEQMRGVGKPLQFGMNLQESSGVFKPAYTLERVRMKGKSEPRLNGVRSVGFLPVLDV